MNLYGDYRVKLWRSFHNAHNLIKQKLIGLTERTFQREGSLYLACNDRNAFFTPEERTITLCGHVKKYALTFLLDIIYIRFGIQTNCGYSDGY